MNNLDHDSRYTDLSKEAVLKSDRDIATISALNEFAIKTGNILVLSGGYATEALCGGKITRAHGDIDAHLVLTGLKSADELFSGVRDLLSKEDTRWNLRSQKTEKVDYLEDDENKEFFEKRRVEVYLNSPHEGNTSYPKKKLIDSQGKEIEVCVVDLIELTASKIHKLFEAKDGVDTSQDRHSSQTDHVDLKRLMKTKEYEKQKIIDALMHTIKLSGKEETRSHERALEEYDFSVSLLKSY